MQTPKWEPQMGTPKWGPQNEGTPNGDPILRPQNGVVLLAQQIQQPLKIGGGPPKVEGCKEGGDPIEGPRNGDHKMGTPKWGTENGDPKMGTPY